MGILTLMISILNLVISNQTKITDHDILSTFCVIILLTMHKAYHVLLVLYCLETET